MKKVPAVLDSILKQYQSSLKVIADLQARQKALKKAGLEYGSPNYKNGRYLRIVKPAAGDNGRQFQYIGADPEKQKAVLEAIDRGKVYDELEKQIIELNNALAKLEHGLEYVESSFSWSHQVAASHAIA
jgi:hypothetical protein